MVLSPEGKKSSLPVLRVFKFYCLTNAIGGSQSPRWEPSQTEEPSSWLRITSEPLDSDCRCQGLAFLTTVEVPWHLSLCLVGVSCLPSCLTGCLPAFRWAQMPCCSAINMRGRAAGCPAAQGTSWGLWELLNLTSDLGKALTCRKDTASSHISSYCCLCAPCLSASRGRRRGGGRPVCWGRLGGHLAMVSTVNTILHKSSLK